MLGFFGFAFAFEQGGEVSQGHRAARGGLGGQAPQGRLCRRAITRTLLGQRELELGTDVGWVFGEKGLVHLHRGPVVALGAQHGAEAGLCLGEVGPVKERQFEGPAGFWAVAALIFDQGPQVVGARIFGSQRTGHVGMKFSQFKALAHFEPQANGLEARQFPRGGVANQPFDGAEGGGVVAPGLGVEGRAKSRRPVSRQQDGRQSERYIHTLAPITRAVYAASSFFLLCRGAVVDVSDRTLSSLGFDDIRQALAGRCRTEVGKARAVARPFLSTRADVEGAFRLIAEARALKAEPLSLPIAGVADVRTSVERAAKDGMLEPRELIAVCQALFAFERGNEVLSERAEKFPGLAMIGRHLPVLDRLATRLDRSFETSGEISDRASPALKDAREHARGLHRRIRARLDELLRDERFGSNLRESYYSVRNDRYVVPVMSSHQREVTGIVHNASGSGQTLFVEPQEMIGLGNELAIAQSIVLEEERKVLIELSGLVGREAHKIIEGVKACGELDELEACALLANDLNANAPALEPADGVLHLKALRHPRLVLKSGTDVIANDVELTGTARSLVVSGPNAGGKTVTLTGTGLCALMVRSGLPIPVDEGSTVPLFNQVHSAIGDQQDLQAGLSTFSAHVTLLKDITTRAKRGALVLIDEIAADTDPREGAAIATAVLEDLLERGAIVLVTTHLEELKALAHLDPRFVNARVGFDSKKMAPTYRLQMGFAGASSAIDIARRVGLAERICTRAHDLATNAGGALSKALAANEEERRKLFDQRDAAERDARRANELKAQLERELESTQKKRKEEELKFREALRAELEFARNQLRTLIDKLENEKSGLKAAQQAAAELTQRINEQTVAERSVRVELKPEVADAAPLELKPGARATHKGLGNEVEIIDVAGDFAVVAMGSLKMRVAVSELGGARKAAAPSRFPASPKRDDQMKKADAAGAKPLTLASPTLDVRGQRADDALRQVEQFLDRVSRAGDDAAIVIHGHGTGALKVSVREYLERSPYAKSFRAGDNSEGGDGATVVILA